MENLPGLPDNIRPSSGGGYWVGFATVRQKNVFSFVDYCSTRPWIKTLLTKVNLMMFQIETSAIEFHICYFYIKNIKHNSSIQVLFNTHILLTAITTDQSKINQRISFSIN